MIDVAIVVGHSSRDPGAVAADGITEHEWCGDLASRLHMACLSRGIRSAVYRRPDLPYRDAMGVLARGLNAAALRLVIELHFNALDKTRSGSCALHWPGSVRGQVAAAALSRAASEAIRIRDLGAIAQARSWAQSRFENGRPVPAGPPLYVLQWTRAPAVIVESHFGDNAGDHMAATSARDGGVLPGALADAAGRVLQCWV